jgi:phosphate butyryltransferase
MEAIQNFTEMISHLQGRSQRKRVAVVCPYDEGTQGAVLKALENEMIDALLVGEREKMGNAFDAFGQHATYVEAANADEAALQAVTLCREGRADVMMKGLLNTDDLLRAILNKETGLLPKGRVLTHVTCAQIPGYDKLLFVSDVAVIPYPTAQQRVEQLRYLLGMCRNMGIGRPRVGLINCTEKVNAKHFPFTAEYKELIAQAEAGEYGPCIVDGPLDLKTCLSAHALHKKGIVSPLEGHADALIFPDIQAGNVFYKTITLFTQAQTAAILCGPQVPVVLPSRGDSVENKFYSIALASLQ